MATDLTLEDAAEKFDLITAYSSWDLQTKAEREQAEKDAEDAQKDLEREQENEAKVAAQPTPPDEPEAKATPAKTSSQYSSGKSGK